MVFVPVACTSTSTPYSLVACPNKSGLNPAVALQFLQSLGRPDLMVKV